MWAAEPHRETCCTVRSSVMRWPALKACERSSSGLELGSKSLEDGLLLLVGCLLGGLIQDGGGDCPLLTSIFWLLQSKIHTVSRAPQIHSAVSGLSRRSQWAITIHDDLMHKAGLLSFSVPDQANLTVAMTDFQDQKNGDNSAIHPRLSKLNSMRSVSWQRQNDMPCWRACP